MFTTLPTEVQIQVLSQAHSPRGVSHEYDQLTQHIQTRKLEHYTSRTFIVSLYSSSSKDLHKKLFYKSSVSHDAQVTQMSLCEMDHKESLITIKNVKDAYVNKSHLDLTLSEEQSSIKLFLAIQCDGETIFETSIRVKEGVKQVTKNGVQLEMEMIRGEKENKDGLYDYEDSYNYSLNVKSIKVKNQDMVKMFEKDDYMFVRC